MAGCEHEQLVCARCEASVRRLDVADAALTRFYMDAQSLIGEFARRGGTVEGLGRRLRDLGANHRIRVAIDVPAPGLTRTERRRSKVKELPDRPRVLGVAKVAKAATSKRQAG